MAWIFPFLPLILSTPPVYEHRNFRPRFCLGASLARMEIRVLLEELIPRLASVEPAGQAERMASSFVGGVKHLPVRMRVRPAGGWAGSPMMAPGEGSTVQHGSGDRARVR